MFKDNLIAYPVTGALWTEAFFSKKKLIKRITIIGKEEI